ncbi:MAG: hypothetical protein KA267_04570 [Gemmatimonadales bacterium]|nr:hypothetical protein [Gemmatimonadota bacterium]MBP6443273.1 hypothetical protein [Gemmatimonadales bacterium]
MATSRRHHALLLALTCLPVGVAAAQTATLESLAWRTPALRSLRNVVTQDSLFAPALLACRAASIALQGQVVAKLLEGADSAAAARHTAIPAAQWDVTCLLRTVDTLPGLFSRPGSVSRIEEVVGLARSGGLGVAQRQTFAERLAAATPAMPTTPAALKDEVRQEYLADFVRDRLGEDESLRRGQQLPDLSRPPAPLSVIMPPANFPTSMFGKQVVATFRLGPDGVVEIVSMQPEIGDSTYRTALLTTFMRYRFRPATDQQGRPVGGTYVYTFSFNRGTRP